MKQLNLVSTLFQMYGITDNLPFQFQTAIFFKDYQNAQ